MGSEEGPGVGLEVTGMSVGLPLGTGVGFAVGSSVGTGVGLIVGSSLGKGVGASQTW